MNPNLTCRYAYASLHIVRFDGGQLKRLRLERKWDQHRLAEAARAHGVGITQSQISRYENDHEPSGRNALALATALGVDVRELYADALPSEDDEEEAALSFDDFLRLRIRQILREEADRLGATG